LVVINFRDLSPQIVGGVREFADMSPNVCVRWRPFRDGRSDTDSDHQPPVLSCPPREQDTTCAAARWQPR
jgi:hypothetical protein